MTDPHSEGGERLESMLRSSAGRFDSGFADRVMDRIEQEPPLRLELATVMASQFRRLVPIGLAAGLALAAFNIARADEAAGQTVAEAAFGLVPPEQSSLYTINIPGISDGVNP